MGYTLSLLWGSNRPRCRIAMTLAQPKLASATRPTVWGLDPVRLHDYYWAARGVHVVRQGDTSPLPLDAELYLLADPRTLCIFRLHGLVEDLSWLKPQLLYVRLSNSRDRGYRESVVQDGQGRFLAFRRHYGGADARLARVGLTPHRWVAQLWQNSDDPASAWRLLRRRIQRDRRDAATINGRAYEQSDRAELAQFVRDLVRFWDHPASTVAGLRSMGHGVWAHADAAVDRSAKFVGNVWVGAGRKIQATDTVVGPAVLWDDPAARPQPQPIRWRDLEAFESAVRTPHVSSMSSVEQLGKRLFDILFAALMIILTSPLWLVTAIAILIEDGRPIFFAHRRETLGGREFPCLKFRSMRKDADRVKAELAKQNQADGPQFFIENDPRLTRVGRLIRKLNIDELPQFLNVLLGHMSVVGPRPSPRSENQCCPAWREARLSVRPGVTGLWQVARTRRRGADFQEWIKYDIEYVESANWRLDLLIIARTLRVILKGLIRR